MSLPAGTVTFLFTDIEGSTRLLDGLGPEAYAEALSTHRRALRSAFAAHGGVEVERQGDSFFFAFARAADAVAAALASQAALGGGPISVRMGLHTGLPIVAAEGYVGMDVHRAARIAAVAHGGQVLLSDATRQLVDGIDVRDLGLHRLKDLDEPLRLFQLGDREFPPLKSLYRANLPVQTTQLIGRDDALDGLCELVERRDVRLVTLTGPGGIGKTRLALAGAERVARGFPDGVHWIALQALRDTELVLPTIAQALETKDVAATVSNGAVLLVLDNFEQVVDAATVVSDLLASCPHLVILVTSREPLHVRAEHEWPVPPLAEEAAVELFAERAQAVRPEFSPGEEADAICRRLDGLPLAIELAAAHVRSLSPGAMLERFERRLDLLGAGPRDLPERHRTMRSTIAWSDALLSVAERTFFRRLSVFRGGCTLEAAGLVCNPANEVGDTLTLAETLLDASLVHAQTATDGETRLQLLQTIGEYAAESLAADGERELVMNRHGEHFLFLAEQAEPHLTGADQGRWIARIEQEQDNFREALAFAVDTGQTNRELRLAGSLGFFWSVRGRHLAEGRRHLDGALARGGAAPADLRAKALRQNAWIAIRQGQLEDALSLAEEAVEIYRSLGDASGTHNTLDALAAVLIETGEAAKARPVLEESLALARTLGNVNYVAATLNNLASLALAERQYGRAEELARESFEVSSQLGVSYGSAIALYNIGAAQALQGAFVDALPNVRESLRLSDELGDDEGLVYCLEAIALLRAEGGEAAMAAELLGCAEARGEEIGVKRAQFEQLMYERAVNAVRARVTDEEYAGCWAAGRGMSVDAAVAGLGH